MVDSSEAEHRDLEDVADILRRSCFSISKVVRGVSGKHLEILFVAASLQEMLWHAHPPVPGASLPRTSYTSYPGMASSRSSKNHSHSSSYKVSWTMRHIPKGHLDDPTICKFRPGVVRFQEPDVPRCLYGICHGAQR